MPDPRPTREQVLEVMRSHLEAREVDRAEVVEGAVLAELDIDSLALQTLAQELEDEFGVTITENDAMDLQTVGQTIDFVVARAGGAAEVSR